MWWRCLVVSCGGAPRARSCPVVHGAPFALACGPDMPHRPVVTGVERRSPPGERPSMHLTRPSLADLGLRSDARARSMRTNTSNTLVLFSHSTDHHARGALLTFVKLENQRAMSITSARHASRQHGRLQPCTAREPPRTPQKLSPPNVEGKSLRCTYLHQTSSKKTHMPMFSTSSCTEICLRVQRKSCACCVADVHRSWADASHAQQTQVKARKSVSNSPSVYAS